MRKHLLRLALPCFFVCRPFSAPELHIKILQRSVCPGTYFTDYFKKREAFIVLIIFLLRALWHISPPQILSISSFLLQSFVLRTMNSNPPLSALSTLYVSTWFLVFLYYFSLLVSKSSPCCCGCLNPVEVFAQSSSMSAISILHSLWFHATHASVNSSVLFPM